MAKKTGRRNAKRPGKAPRQIAVVSIDLPKFTREQLISGITGESGALIRMASAQDLERAGYWETMSTGLAAQTAVDLVASSQAGVLSSALLAGADEPEAFHRSIRHHSVTKDDPTSAVLAAFGIFVAEVDGAVVGSLGGGPPSSFVGRAARSRPPGEFIQTMLRGLKGAAKINYVSVEPMHRKQGIARDLIGVATEVFSRCGYSTLYGQFTTVNELGDFYSDLGFEVLAPGQVLNMRNVYGFDAILTAEFGEQLFSRSLQPV